MNMGLLILYCLIGGMTILIGFAIVFLILSAMADRMNARKYRRLIAERDNT